MDSDDGHRKRRQIWKKKITGYNHFPVLSFKNLPHNKVKYPRQPFNVHAGMPIWSVALWE